MERARPAAAVAAHIHPTTSQSHLVLGLGLGLGFLGTRLVTVSAAPLHPFHHRNSRAAGPRWLRVWRPPSASATWEPRLLALRLSVLERRVLATEYNKIVDRLLVDLRAVFQSGAELCVKCCGSWLSKRFEVGSFWPPREISRSFILKEGA